MGKKRDPPNSESEPEESGRSAAERTSSEEVDEDEIDSSFVSNGGNQGMLSEYEKQRLARIAENKARMEAFGIHKKASSLRASVKKSTQRKGKLKAVDDDEDYKPVDDDADADADADDDDDGGDEDDDDDFVGSKSSSRSRGNKVKNKVATPGKRASAKKSSIRADSVKEEDELMQAIALSLQDTNVKGRKGNAQLDTDAARRKRKQSFTNRVKMTEDELILHFFQFDVSGNGTIRIKDLKRVAAAHDFTWTETELADMIHCFDSDGDGKLKLDDFRKIVGRCNMTQG